MKPMNVQKIREDSPVCSKYVYFDTAAAAAPTRANIDTVTAYLSRSCEEGLYMPAFRRETYQRIEDIRAKTAKFINAKASEIAFVKNGSEAISIVAQGGGWKAGDEIIVSSFEILSNLVPWLRLQERAGIKVVTAMARDNGLLHPDDIAKLITDRTRLITFSQLSNVTGGLQPVQEICDLARKHKVRTLVCAAQSLGMVPIDVQLLGCDYLAACGRKSLRAIEGSGILFIREELIAETEPCLVGWWNSSYDSATKTVTLNPTAKRFEAGCPIVPAIVSMENAIEYASDIGVDAIFERVRKLTAYTVEKLKTLPGAELYGPEEISERLAIVTFNIKSVDASEMVLALEKHGIIIEAGHFMADAIMKRYNITKMARISLHYFNDESEIDRTVGLIRDMAAR